MNVVLDDREKTRLLRDGIAQNYRRLIDTALAEVDLERQPIPHGTLEPFHKQSQQIERLLRLLGRLEAALAVLHRDPDAATEPDQVQRLRSKAADTRTEIIKNAESLIVLLNKIRKS